jgi:hypothetical protein
MWTLFVPSTTFMSSLHEVVGHGLTARILGGSFTGFQIGRSPQAFVFPAEGAPRWHFVLIYAGGISAELFAGILLFGIERVFAKRLGDTWRLALIVAGAMGIMEAGTYLVYGSAGNYDDPFLIYETLGSQPWVKAGLFAIGAVVYGGGLAWFKRRLLEIASRLVALPSFWKRLGFVALLFDVFVGGSTALPSRASSPQFHVAPARALIVVLILVSTLIAAWRSVEPPPAPPRSLSPWLVAGNAALALATLVLVGLFLSGKPVMF